MEGREFITAYDVLFIIEEGLIAQKFFSAW